MIVQEQITVNGRNLIHTYSDNYLKIRQETGVVYDEAIDVLNSGHTYIETEEQIAYEMDDREALNAILGRRNDYEQS